MNTLPMTAAGYSVLERELKRRIQLDRPRLIERLQEAIADDSNLAENPEYQAVKSEQEINEARIAELKDKLARAEVIAFRRYGQIWHHSVADRRRYRREQGMADRGRTRGRRTRGKHFGDVAYCACADWQEQGRDGRG